MNVQNRLQLTRAEADLVERFSAVAGELPGDARMAQRRDEAIETLKFAGLPTRRVEAFHYTDLRRLLEVAPETGDGSTDIGMPPLLAGSTSLTLADGAALPVPALPDGVAASTVAGLLALDGSNGDTGASGPEDPVGLVNTAFLSDGWDIQIADGVRLAEPLEVRNLHRGGHAHVRISVRTGSGASATVIERQSGDGTALVSSISELDLREDADVTWIILQEQGAKVTHLARFAARIGRNARLKLFVVNVGGKLVRQEVDVTAAAEGGSFQLRGVNLLGGESHTDLTMTLAHDQPNTTSTEIVRNVVTDRAKGVFQGQIRVAPSAQKTDARMACNTLLLSDDADFSAKPELEIFADDVACGHGATVAEIDYNHLFYLMARGIPEKEARGLLIKAFVAEIVEELDNEALVEALEDRIDTWLADHG